MRGIALGIALSFAACGGGQSEPATNASTGSPSAGGAGGSVRPPPAQDWTRDILSTGLELDVVTRVGKATIALAPLASQAASFEIGDLSITSVSDDSGPLQYMTNGKELDVGVPAGAHPATIVVDYSFKPHTKMDGWLPKQQVTFLWPYFCGNLFPCKSDPSDGLSFTMKVTGSAPTLLAVYPVTIPADAPSYMPAVAIGNFTKLDLGKTSAGTQVSAWHLPGQAAAAAIGTAHLRQAFDFYEKTYGKYTFGSEVGSVSAAWSGDAVGGMEHHPFWHVASGSFSDEVTHVHEAAHGWFGDGVRIQCWEDFVLSEGTVSYIAAHVLEGLGVDAWHGYECKLKSLCTGSGNTIALPSTCDKIDLLHDPLWSDVPYMKGAFFYRAVAKLIGDLALDQALSGFHAANVSKSAHMKDLVAFIESKVDAPSSGVDRGAQEELARDARLPGRSRDALSMRPRRPTLASGSPCRAADTLRKARHRDVAAELLAASREQHKGRPAFLDELARVQS